MMLLYLRSSHKTYPIFKCVISTSNRYASEYASHENSRFMQKLLSRSTKSKKKWYQPHLAEPTTLPGHNLKPVKKGITEAHRTRVCQLSHVLYDKITELMNSSEFSEEIVNKQVLVTSVKMQLDFSSIHVYWDCHRPDAADLETLLLNHANKLRSLLISYHVLGRIPPIIFKKDKSHGDLAVIDQLLEIADYGPDYVPSNPHIRIKSYREISSQTPETKNVDVVSELSKNLTQMTIDKALSAQSTQGSNTSESEISNLLAGKTPEEIPEDSLTPGFVFRSDIYGLPRDKLLRKIVAQRDRVKFHPEDLETKSHTSNTELEAWKLVQQRDKVLLLKEKKSLTQIKQKLLDRQVEDF